MSYNFWIYDICMIKCEIEAKSLSYMMHIWLIYGLIYHRNCYFTKTLVFQPRVLMDLWLRMISLSIESWFPDVFIEIIAVNMRFITSLSVSNCCLLLLLYICGLFEYPYVFCHVNYDTSIKNQRFLYSPSEYHIYIIILW